MRDQGGATLRHMRTLFQQGTVAGLTDGELLERYRSRGGQTGELAFAALVERHGAMVLRVCRRILTDPNDAQDAFQATFLVLARKPGSVRSRDSIAAWLFGVASRVASSARSSSTRRRLKERTFAELAARRGTARDHGELISQLHEEIERLPERYRVPIVLCDLEGLTHEQAAGHLGCPIGTVKSRLARGRERLGNRMKRLNTGATFWGSEIPPAVRAGVTPSRGLIEATTSAALQAAAGHLPAGTVPASVLSLVSGAMLMMRRESLNRWACAAALASALTGCGVAAAGMLSGPIDSNPSPPVSEPGAPGDSPRPGGVVSPRAEGKTVRYDVTFLEAPGLSFRKTGLNPVFDIEPHGSLTFLSDLEADLLTRQIQSAPKGVAVQAPGLSAPQESRVFFNNPADGSPPTSHSADRKPGDAEPPGGPTVRTSGRPGQGKKIQGCEVRLQSDLSADGMYLALKVDIHDQHVVEIHTDRGEGDRRIEVPETVRNEIHQKVTVPATRSAVLISLGLYRTVGAGGVSSVNERLVLIRTSGPRSPSAAPRLRAVPPPPAVP